VASRPASHVLGLEDQVIEGSTLGLECISAPMVHFAMPHFTFISTACDALVGQEKARKSLEKHTAE